MAASVCKKSSKLPSLSPVALPLALMMPAVTVSPIPIGLPHQGRRGEDRAFAQDARGENDFTEQHGSPLCRWCAELTHQVPDVRFKRRIASPGKSLSLNCVIYSPPLCTHIPPPKDVPDSPSVQSNETNAFASAGTCQST